MVKQNHEFESEVQTRQKRERLGNKEKRKDIYPENLDIVLFP